jgi:hypothetical protein
VNKEEQLADLIGAIYDAVGNPPLWEALLLKFADIVEGTMTSLVLYSPQQRVGHLSSAVRFDPAYQQLYNDYYVSIDQWGVNSRGFIVPGNVVPGREFQETFQRRPNIMVSVPGMRAR